VPVKKVVVEEDGKTQDVYIAMTDEEAKDKGYTDYMDIVAQEETKDELRKKVPKQQPKDKEHISGTLKEVSEYRRRRQSEFPRRYF